VLRIFAEAEELNLPAPKNEEISLCLRFTVYLAQPHQKNPSNRKSRDTSHRTSNQTSKAVCIRPKRGKLTRKETMLVLFLNH
jgi:predicted HTH transcriptional regulator